MDYPFTVDDLASKCKVSKQSIYALIKKNQDFVKENSVRKGKKIKYNQDVLNLLLDYYGIEEGKELSQDTPEEAIDAFNDPQRAEETLTTIPQVDDAEEKIKALESQIEALKQELSSAKEQISELLRQNGQVLLLLQEEKQEKIKLLEAPKKSFLERFHFFSKRKD